MEESNYKAEQQFQLADDLIKQNELEDAINVLHNILYDDPSFGKAHNHLGWIYETKYKDYKKAEEHYKLSLKLSPSYPAAYINYTYFLSTLGRWDELEEHLLKSEQVDGVSKATLANEWGILYESRQRLPEAIEQYKKYLSMAFDDSAIEAAQKNINRCKKKMEILKDL